MIKTEGATVFGTKPIGSFGVSYSQKKCTVAKSQQISELILDCVTGDMRPLTIVANRGFRELVRLLEPVMICSDI